MASKTKTTAELDYRPSYLAAGVAALAVFILYLATLSPSTAMWDTSEYIASAYIMGLPHPPGNPFFVIIGRFFTLLPIAANIAMRVNILAALGSAVSAGMWFLVTERVLVSWFPERWQRIVGGALAVLIGATAFTVWNQSVVNEKVYTVALAGVALVCWLTVRWCDDPDGLRADRILVLIGYLLGLGYANHMAGMLAAPAVVVAVLVRRPHTITRWRLLAGIAGAVLLGMTPFISQPLRSGHFPAINEGETTGCVTQFAWSCTLDQKTYDRFMYNFNRTQYGKVALTDRQAPFTAQVDMWWLYFKWQWIRDRHAEHPGIQNMLAVLFLLLGILGGYVHWKHDRDSFWFFGPLMFILTFGLIYYLNFKYGWSESPELRDVAREVRDRDYFYLWSFSAWSVWASLGLIFCWESIAALIGADEVKLGGEVVEVPRRMSWYLASPVLLIALIPLFGNWNQASRHGETFTRDFAADLLNSVEPYGVLVVAGDNDTFPLWYAQEVEGIRKDVLVVNTSLMNTDWYNRQILRRPVFTYDEANGPAIYRGKVWKKPTGVALKMTMTELDALPEVMQLPGPQVFKKGNITASVQLPYNQITRADIVVLRLISDNDDRPMYFSRTTGNYGEQLGFGSYLLTQGLARKLLPNQPSAASKDTVVVPGAGWVDVPTTEALWKTFKAPASIIKRGDWMDRPSEGIPSLFVMTGVILGESLMHEGRTADADHVLDQSEQIARAARLEDLYHLRQMVQPQLQVAPETTQSGAP